MKEKILDATIVIFKEKGLKLTMDDIAKELSMSKKTIYTVFKDKETLFMEMVDYCFDNIKASEQKVLEDESLGTVEKLRAIMSVLPEGYSEVDFRQIYPLKDKYPQVYEKIQSRLESGWENTISLINKGVSEGLIRPINIGVFKTMMEAAIEQFLQKDTLIINDIEYAEALNMVVDILLDGIRIR